MHELSRDLIRVTALLVGILRGSLERGQSILAELTVPILAQLGNLAILLRQNRLRAFDVRLQFRDLKRKEGRKAKNCP